MTTTLTPTRVDFGNPAVRRRRRLRWAVAVLTAVLVAALGWTVMFSSLLAVQSVRVVGAEGPPAEAVLAAAAVPPGVPLARVDTGAAEVAILALPWVSSVEVRRGWPSEIVIAVEPRTAIAVTGTGGAKQGVDADGVAFDVPGAQVRSLPAVTADGVGLTAAMQVLAELPPQIRGGVVRVSATTRDNVDLTFKSGATVHWGSAEQGDFKARVLLALLQRKADVYDVSAPELPTTFVSR